MNYRKFLNRDSTLSAMIISYYEFDSDTNVKFFNLDISDCFRKVSFNNSDHYKEVFNNLYKHFKKIKTFLKNYYKTSKPNSFVIREFLQSIKLVDIDIIENTPFIFFYAHKEKQFDSKEVKLILFDGKKSITLDFGTWKHTKKETENNIIKIDRLIEGTEKLIDKLRENHEFT